MNPNGSNGIAPNLSATQSMSAHKRLYSVWPGNNKFLFGGRLVLGSDTKSLYMTTFMIGGPAIIFCIKMIIRYRDHDPIFGHSVLIIGLILTFMALLFLCMTSARDPGIIPRNLEPTPREEQDDSFSSIGFESGSSMRLPAMKDVKVNGYTIKVKYCETCHLYRPPRASHCSVCNNCVQKFDHHCPWVGQCIGLRNYKTFMMFISSTTLLCVYVFCFSLVSLLHRSQKVSRSFADDIISACLALYCFVVVWFVGGLTAFHFYLICKNQTTYENFRYRYEKKKNPFNLGISMNLKQTFLLRTPPSQVNFREWVLLEDIQRNQGSPIHRDGSLRAGRKF